MRSACRRVCLRRISIGKVRSRKSQGGPRATWKKFCWKTRCASASGIRRGRRKSWAFHPRRCWRNCAARDWKSDKRPGSRHGRDKFRPASTDYWGRTPVCRDGAEGPDAIIHGVVAYCAHKCGEFGRAEKAGNGIRQIGVRRTFAGDNSPNPRQDFAKIPTIEIAPQAFGWFGEFQNGDGATGLEHALNLTQACFIIGEVAKAEGAGHQVKGSTGKGKPERVGLEKRHWRRGALVPWLLFGDAFFTCSNEHGMGEIRADDADPSGARESESEVTGSTAEIEGESIGAAEDGLQMPGGACAPKAIELQRQKMIEQIVSRSDLRKHFADFVRGIGFGNRTFGARALNWCGRLRHGGLAKACCWR